MDNTGCDCHIAEFARSKRAPAIRDGCRFAIKRHSDRPRHSWEKSNRATVFVHNKLHQHISSLRLAAFLTACALGVAIIGVHRGWFDFARNASSLERSFARQGRQLLPVSTAFPKGRAGQTIAVKLADLKSHQLYLRNPADDYSWLYTDEDGTVATRAGRLAVVKESLELLMTPSGVTLFIDDAPVKTDTVLWDVFWVSAPNTPPPPKTKVIPSLSVRDDFMRKDIELHPYARITAGTVHLAQHGGGMPSNSTEEADPNFQRAVNAFSVQASNGGRLTYCVHSPRQWGDVHAEARFYFGIPKTGHVIDRNTRPTGTDMLVVMGAEGGLQAAFGWFGNEERFVLLRRQGNKPWSLMKAWQKKRPPLTNWVKVGLECRLGYRITGILDDVPVLSADFPGRLRGPFHVQSGEGLVEFDDVRAWSLPTPPKLPAPLLIRSRNFAGKQRKRKADPKQFDEWASSSHAFIRIRWKTAESKARCAAIVTNAGLLGDFVCKSPAIPLSSNAQRVTYRFAVYRAKADGSTDIRTDTPAWTLRARRTADGWIVRRRDDVFSGPDSDLAMPDVTIARRTDAGGRICLRTSGRWLSLSDPMPGPLYLAIIRVLASKSGGRFVLSPYPAHHVVLCANLVHELFEEAPTAWNWVDGAFRMDCRWACQNQWNSMACGSTGLPYLTSKRVFSGDQVHEAFMSLRAVFPWDAGDASFRYDAEQDRANKFPRLIAANGWYNRHDLNMSFCSDGKNPLSGYCVIFGGYDNTVTRLLRRGVPVAETRQSRRLFSKAASFMVVHYPWWKFTVHKTGPRIRVFLDDDLLFDYTDPKPINGGHIGFWSVRNGFPISRISSMARRITWKRHAFYVTESTDSRWKPLVRDAVVIRSEPGTDQVRVTNTFGGGFFAVRYTPDKPVDLRQTPRLDLPLRPGPGTRVCLHLQIGGRPFIVRLGDSPLDGIKAFLVPASEKGECFHIPTIPGSVVRSNYCLAELPGDTSVVRLDLLGALRKLAGDSVEPVLSFLTIGNSSNADYLLAGHGGNAAGSTYTVGAPIFSK